jgi:hypothetical protein
MDHLKGFLRTVPPMNEIPEIYQIIYLTKRLVEKRGSYT